VVILNKIGCQASGFAKCFGVKRFKKKSPCVTKDSGSENQDLIKGLKRLNLEGARHLKHPLTQNIEQILAVAAFGQGSGKLLQCLVIDPAAAPGDFLWACDF